MIREKQQLDLAMNPLPPPPPPRPNVFVYSEEDVMVEEVYKNGEWKEIPVVIEINMWRFLCDCHEFTDGHCYGCDDKASDLRYCMEIPLEGYLQVRFGAPQ